jgi:hypothetical protein
MTQIMNIYDYQRPVGKIQDNQELRLEFIRQYDAKSHKDIALFSMAYGKHLLEITAYPEDAEIKASFNAIQRWLDGLTNYHEARNLSGEISTLARNEIDPIKVRFYRTMAQMSAVTHVKYHGLWMTDFAITLINRMFPDDQEAVAKERKFQIHLMQKH